MDLKIAIALTAALISGAPLAAQAGPLRVLQSNPRWFTDGSGKAVYLAGSHTWWNLQDSGHLLPETHNPPPAFDYNGYLDLLSRHGHNFFRLWRWESPMWHDSKSSKDPVQYCRPHPWLRTGPGLAADGQPKFDLERFDPEYFTRLRSRVAAAGARGIYVSIMLFEGWAVQFRDAWDYHPFNAANNRNGIGGSGQDYYTLADKRVTAFQEAYLRKVADTVNDLDNVLYEVVNEAGPYSTEWQYHVIRYMKQYEASKPKAHPVGMTFQYRGGSNRTLYESPADWISPNTGEGGENYVENPPANHPEKVIVNDTDHQGGHTVGDAVWVWKSFCRGLNVAFMEEMTPSPTWQDSAREGMAQTRRFAERVNLAAMIPEEKISQTRYCLAARGREYLIFQNGARGEFTVDLSGAPGPFSVEWFSVITGKTVPGKPVAGGTPRTFTTPFGGPAVLYLTLAPEGRPK